MWKGSMSAVTPGLSGVHPDAEQALEQQHQREKLVSRDPNTSQQVVLSSGP